MYLPNNVPKQVTEYNKFENAIKNYIANFKMNIGDKEYIVAFEFCLTMTDRNVQQDDMIVELN